MQAQYTSFRHYQVESGLSNNTVYACVQDHEGFMWFGTKDGLNRFDGYRFKTFYIPVKGFDQTAYFNSTLFVSASGDLWVGCRNGLFKFDREYEKLIPFADSLTEINDINEDKDGYIWFIAGANLYQLQPKTKYIKTFDAAQYFTATSICVTRKQLWVGTNDGFLQKYDAIHHTFTAYNLFKHSPSAVTHRIQKIKQAQSGNALWIGTYSQGLKQFNTIDGSYTDVLNYNKTGNALLVRDILQNNNTETWLATEAGVIIINHQNNTIENVTKKFTDPYSISDNAVYALCKDRSGGIWAGTYFGGVNYYAAQYDNFRKFLPGNNQTGLSGNIVREICGDKNGNIWIGTEDAGLNRLNPSTGIITQVTPTGKPGSIAYSNIHGLVADDNQLWIGTFEHGLDLLNIHTGKVFKTYKAGNGKHDLKSNFIVSLLKSKNGDIYVGTSNSVFLYNKKIDAFDTIAGIPGGTFISCMLEDDNGVIWLGTHDRGIYYYNPQTRSYGQFTTNPNHRNALTANTVNAIYEDDQQRLWIATEGGGICILDKTRKNFSLMNTTNGLPANFVFKILQDAQKNYWITTSRGLVQYSGHTNSTRVFSKSSGLLSDQFNYNSGYIDDKGIVYMGSVKGLISFNPSSLLPVAPNLPIYITGLQVMDKEAVIGKQNSPLNKSILYTGSIKLPYNQSSFSIDFAAINFVAPEITRYKYIMHGLDENWTTLEANRKLYFTGLEPGNYKLEIRTINSNGSLSVNAVHLSVNIMPPFWRSKTAYLLYMIAIVGIAYFIINRYHVQQQQRQLRKIELLENEKAKELYKSKIEFFTNIAHEIRTPLTLIKLPLEKIMNAPTNRVYLNDNLRIMEKNTNRLVELTNQLLDFRKIEHNSVTLSFVKTDIIDLLKDIFNSFKPAAEQKNVSYNLEVPRIPFQAYVDAEAFKKMASNLISNAVKYSEQEVKVKLLPFSSDDTYFSIRFLNDGFLIPNDARKKIFEPFVRLKETDKERGTGIGLALTQSLAQMHNGTLAVDVTDNLNVFTLSLPILQETVFEFTEANNNTDKNVEEALLKTDIEKKVILLVEDNKEVLDFVAGELSGEFAVLKATNGVEALDKIAETNVQLILSDVMMPVMDGYALCKEIKTNTEYNHIPIILLTAKTSLQAKIEGLELGADAYIEKPFSQQHLLAQIRSLIYNRDKIKEHYASTPQAGIDTMAYSKADEKFLTTINELIDANLNNAQFSVDDIAKHLNFSRPTLYRKIKSLSNLSPNDLIRVAKLKKAAALLATGNYKIYEVADKVGYSLATNFSRDFVKQFNISPSDYLGGKSKEHEKIQL